jgi:branched-chain amino acid transport system permease protein
MRRALSHPLAPVVLLALVVAAAPLAFPSAFYFRVAALLWVYALAAIGLNLLMGLAGQVSLGHAGFMGMGAYAVAIGPAHLGGPGWAAAPLGAALAGLVAFLVGRPILRLRGHYLAVATLGFGILVTMVLTNEARWTGGPDGMPVPRLVLFGERITGAATWYWIAGTLLVIGAWIAVNLAGSPTGRALRAIHDSEVAARVCGVDVARYKLWVFTLSAVYASVAGSTLGFLNGLVTPDIASFLRSVELVTMVVLGGLGSVIGAVVGAAVIVVLPQALTAFHEYEHVLLGLIMIACMIFLRQGVVPSLTARLRARPA